MAKKISRVLEGVAITGAAVGGLSVFGDASLAYAYTSEDMVDAVVSGELVLEVAEPVENEALTASEPEIVIVAAEIQTEDVVTEEIAEDSLQEIEVVVEEETHVAAQAEETEVEDEPTVETELDSEPGLAIETDDESIVDSELDMDSEVELLEMTEVEIQATVESVLAEIEQQAAEYIQTNDDFIAAGFANEGIDAQAEIVNEKLQEEEAARTALAENGTQLKMNNYYEKYGRGLAIEMIKYKLLLDGEVDAEHINQVFYKYYSSNYENNHFVVKYLKEVDGQTVYVERYYDYVTCDKDGNSIYQGRGVNENDSTIVSGINVLEKTPIYSSTVKNQKVWGQEFKANQRTDFEVVDGTKKGVEWYTLSQYKADISTRNVMLEKLASLESNMDSLASQLELLEIQAAEAAAQAEAEEVLSEVVVEPETEEVLSEVVVEPETVVEENIVEVEVEPVVEEIIEIEDDASEVSETVEEVIITEDEAALEVVNSEDEAALEVVNSEDEAALEVVNSEVEIVEEVVSPVEEIVEEAVVSEPEIVIIEETEIPKAAAEIIVEEKTTEAKEGKTSELVQVGVTEILEAISEESSDYRPQPVVIDKEEVLEEKTAVEIEDTNAASTETSAAASEPASKSVQHLRDSADTTVPLAVVEDTTLDIQYIPEEPTFAIGEDGVAKANYMGDPTVIWRGYTLPSLGALTGLLGSVLYRRDKDRRVK